MEKLTQETLNFTEKNIEKIAALFPSAITETTDANGKLKRTINFDQLKQLLSDEVVDGDECYEFTWVGKKQSIIEGNRPIRKTLRPCKEESKNWDNTENLYIEGDNLDVLKLLQNSYLNQVKMIYIDPPYNTGNDFVYRDNFKFSKEDYEEEQGLFDEEENRLFKNTETNGRYHSDWCSMMYSRLQLARNLLTEDGVIFISIDDNEVHNLKKICDEVFGEENFVGQIVLKSNPRGSQSESKLAGLHEYLIVYSKSTFENAIIGHQLSDEMRSEYKYNEGGEDFRLLGLRQRGGFWRRSERPNLFFPIFINPTSGEISLDKNDEFSEVVLPVQPSTGEDGTWRWSKEKIKLSGDELIAKSVKRNGEDIWDIFQKDFLDKDQEKRTKAKSIWDEKEINYQNGTIEIKTLLSSGVFDYPKPTYLLKRILEMIRLDSESIILDFFSGSATIAHAVMQLNAEDGGNRKFIMVQLPEETDTNSEAYKAGYKNICEIGKERIRRAGKKIEEELKAKSKEGDLFAEKERKPLDTGFRVLKVDSTNMKDVYYSPSQYNQQMLLELESNIKEDRSDIDLLYGVLLDWGVPLSLPHVTEKIGGKNVHFVNDADLVACFEENVPEEVIREIASRKPLRVVFRDSSFRNSPDKINVTEIFKTLSPKTTIKVI